MLVKGYLRAFVNDRQDNWQELTQLVEFTINNTASPLSTGFTPFFADCCQHPRCPLAPPTSGTAQEARGCEAVALLMGSVTTETRALLQERQDARKARLDPRRRDVRFAPGDQVLLDSERTPLPSRGLLTPLGWPVHCAGSNGPQHVSARATSRLEGSERVQRLPVAAVLAATGRNVRAAPMH